MNVMTKETLLYMTIELIIMLIPIITLALKLGSWKKEIELKVQNLEKSQDKSEVQFTAILTAVNNIQMSLTRLETKLQIMEKEIDDES